MALIEVKNLVKKYKVNERKNGIIGYLEFLVHPKYTISTAVNDISFDIQEGELVGYIGENGAREIYNNKNAYRTPFTYFWKYYCKWNSSK